MFRPPLLLAMVAASCAAAPAHAQRYKAVVLHPDAGIRVSSASALTLETQVGMGSNTNVIGPSDQRALLWRGTPDSVVELHPPGFQVTDAQGASGERQVGSGSGPATGMHSHALLWTGSAESVVDLHPAGFDNSIARAIAGNSQGGHGDKNHQTRALLWHGTADSVVDLHPAGFSGSSVLDMTEKTQVGAGSVDAPGFPQHALLWHGSAASVIDLHPAGFARSAARGAAAGVQVGEGVAGNGSNSPTHALLWRGSADSVIDLHPAGFEDSQAWGAAGEFQVGGGDGRALLWRGSADSVIDLHALLVAGHPDVDRSMAMDVNERGDVVGFGFSSNGGARAILWTVVPEPRGIRLSVVALVGMFGASRRQCR